MPASEPGARRTRTWSAAIGRGLAAALAFVGAACASFDEDVYLAPLYSHFSRAGGGTEAELFAGAIRVRTETPGGRVSSFALRPLISQIRSEDGDYMTHFLAPLGTARQKGSEQVIQLLPIFRYQEELNDQGNLVWTFFMLPGIVWQQNPEGKIRRAVFPIAGVFENYLTFDKVVFFLFPLYLRTEREGRISTSFLWPIFNFTTGAGGDSSRIFPLYGHNAYEGRYDRWFFLWPFFHYQENNLSRPPRAHETIWSFWPILQREQKGTFVAWSFLWPFFGYSYDDTTGFWAWDGPWPLVRVHGGGESPPSEARERFWPFYSHFKGDGQETWTYAWPLIRFVEETYPDSVRHAEYFIPFWQKWVREDLDGGRTKWEKLWPLYQDFEDPWGERFAFPALNPLWHMPLIDETYAWIYEFWVSETHGLARSERLWGGLYRRERDATEDRSYLPGIWSRRKYVSGGELIEEHATLFGLLRWRSRPDGWEMLSPAFPGPGWPTTRSTEFLPPEAFVSPARDGGS